MSNYPRALSDYARVALAVIRLLNGSAALLTPGAILRRLGVDPNENSVALYALRMFGVRTVLIGAGLLLPSGDVRTWSLRTAPFIHASDTAAAGVLLLRGQLPTRPTMSVVLISMTNVILSVVAQRRRA